MQTSCYDLKRSSGGTISSSLRTGYYRTTTATANAASSDQLLQDCHLLTPGSKCCGQSDGKCICTAELMVSKRRMRHHGHGGPAVGCDFDQKNGHAIVEGVGNNERREVEESELEEPNESVTKEAKNANKMEVYEERDLLEGGNNGCYSFAIMEQDEKCLQVRGFVRREGIKREKGGELAEKGFRLIQTACNERENNENRCDQITDNPEITKTHLSSIGSLDNRTPATHELMLGKRDAKSTSPGHFAMLHHPAWRKTRMATWHPRPQRPG
ncbi:unnamed protein product, partial [Protopolystoma xenopodis]